jgi:NADPH-dependent glutamate synthase beta subunit-like oxidoreductase
LKLFKDDHPFPAVCGRVCHHPCESECTRNDVDQPLAIRELHRFLADYEKQSGEFYIPEIKAEKRDEKMAVIGSGPAGSRLPTTCSAGIQRDNISKNCPNPEA